MDPLELTALCDTSKICGEVCRICLQKNATLNWNNEISEYIGLTYRECYYKYTQLELLVIDPYSQMLCQTCAVDLKESHFLIIKALESHAILQRTQLTEFQIMCIDNENIQFTEECTVGDEENTVCDIETLKIPFQEENKPIALNKPKWKDKDLIEEKVPTIPSPSSNLEQIRSESTINMEMTTNDNEEFVTTAPNIGTFSNGKSNETIKVKKTSQKRNKNKKGSGEIVTTSKKETRKKYMCSNCSKVFINMRSLTRHEETHNKNRERSEICTICGLRFFNKQQLTLHLRTHNEFREKKYKCEFCEKAYYNMGSLNVHRRIHLGQMIPCPLCPKEFHRQDDLNRHSVTAHSSTTIHTNIKEKSKYYVYCKDCNKQLRTTTWKAHQAAHLKEPLMKCSICHKGFFTRSSVTHHMHKVHNYQTRDEYEQYIVYAKPKRLSHLLLEQQDKLKLKTN